MNIKVHYRAAFFSRVDGSNPNPPSGLVPAESSTGAKTKYTVPSIHHIPTNTYMLDSGPIAQFLETTYPEPSLPLTSTLGREIEAQARAVAGAAFRASVMPREIRILLPRSQAYFRRNVEVSLGHPLEDLLEGERENEAWKGVDEGMQAVSKLIMTNKDEGPFLLGAKPSYTDFFIAGSLQCARTVDEGVWERNVRYEGFKQVYEACVLWMGKKD